MPWPPTPSPNSSTPPWPKRSRSPAWLPPPPNVSTGLVEVVKLVQAGMEESVVLAYIERCPTAFEPTVDEILYLNDLGVSARVISALIRHGELAGDETGVASATTHLEVEPMAAAPPPASTIPLASDYAGQPVAGEVAADQAAVQPAEPPAVVAQDPPPAMPAPASVFYHELAPYGSWIELAGYGWCWQPTTVVVNPSWRPYADQGRWLYTDCGWYWQSDYSWGWAPFHYGRWLSHSRCGWVWMPDTVWGPSWVTWRHTPSYCGWAPLPPNCHYVPHYGFTFGGHWVDNDCDFGLTVSLYSFIHWRHFNHHSPHGYYVPRSQTAAIYSHSKAFNNYVMGSNNTVINDGVNWDRLTAYRPTKLRPISVRELSPAAGTQLRPDRVEKNGQSLVIYRPQLPTATPPAITLPGPRSPTSPAARRPMTSPAGPGRTVSRTSDRIADRTEPAHSSAELPGRSLPAHPVSHGVASLSDARPAVGQPLDAPATTAAPPPAPETPLAAPATANRYGSSLRSPTSNPRSQTSIPRSTTRSTSRGRPSGNSSSAAINPRSDANPSPDVAPPPSTALPAPSPRSSSPAYNVTPPSRGDTPRAPTIPRYAPSSTLPSSASARAPAQSWTPPAVPYSSPTPNYSSPSRQPSYSAPAPSMAPPTRSTPMMSPPASAPAPAIRSEPSARAPASAPSVSRSPDPAPSRTPAAPSAAPTSTTRDTSSDSRREAGSRR